MTSITELNVSSSAGVAASVVAAAGRGKDGDRANEEGTSQ
jgi:hypothetical protein